MRNRILTLLAWAAVAHGAVLLGLGNWVWATPADHAHHEVAAAAEALPAHCLFCIDGLSPAAPELPALCLAPALDSRDYAERAPTRCPVLISGVYLARGPPSSTETEPTLLKSDSWRRPWTLEQRDVRCA